MLDGIKTVIHGPARFLGNSVGQSFTSGTSLSEQHHVHSDPDATCFRGLFGVAGEWERLLMIIAAGTARARIGGRDVVLGNNQAIFVPADMSHELWNPGDERATLLLIMFGENA